MRYLRYSINHFIDLGFGSCVDCMCECVYGSW